MEFQTRQSSTFIMNIILIVLAFCMAFVSFFYFRVRDDLFHYSYVFWLIIALTRLAAYEKYIRSLFYRKPVLTVSKDCIYDLAKDIRYYWKDIKEIYDENSYLHVVVYDQNKYLKKIKNPVRRFVNGVSGSPFKINIDMVNIHPDALLEILDDYSTQATAFEKQRVETPN